MRFLLLFARLLLHWLLLLDAVLEALFGLALRVLFDFLFLLLAAQVLSNLLFVLLAVVFFRVSLLLLLLSRLAALQLVRLRRSLALRLSLGVKQEVLRDIRHVDLLFRIARIDLIGVPTQKILILRPIHVTRHCLFGHFQLNSIKN